MRQKLWAMIFFIEIHLVRVIARAIDLLESVLQKSLLNLRGLSRIHKIFSREFTDDNIALKILLLHRKGELSGQGKNPSLPSSVMATIAISFDHDCCFLARSLISRMTASSLALASISMVAVTLCQHSGKSSGSI